MCAPFEMKKLKHEAWMKVEAIDTCFVQHKIVQLSLFFPAQISHTDTWNACKIIPTASGSSSSSRSSDKKQKSKSFKLLLLFHATFLSVDALILLKLFSACPLLRASNRSPHRHRQKERERKTAARNNAFCVSLRVAYFLSSSLFFSLFFSLIRASNWAHATATSSSFITHSNLLTCFNCCCCWPIRAAAAAAIKPAASMWAKSLCLLLDWWWCSS